MATSAVDRTMNIWDIRNFKGPLQKYKLHTVATDLAFSQKNYLSVAMGNVVEVIEICLMNCSLMSGINLISFLPSRFIMTAVKRKRNIRTFDIECSTLWATFNFVLSKMC